MKQQKHIQSPTEQLFQLPQAISEERAVIGALMLESKCFDLIAQILSADMFYDKKHEILYSAIVELHKEQKPVDMLTVLQKITSSGKNEVTAVDIADIAGTVVSSAHIECHALIIKEKYLKRRAIEINEEIKRKCYEGIEDIEDILFNAGKEFESLQETLIGNSDAKHISHILSDSITEMYLRIDLEKKGIQPGIPTGIFDLNRITGGWQKSELIVIAARPAMGKTAIALHFAKAAAKNNVTVAMFSLEMSDVSLANRLLLSETNISPENFKSGKLSQNDTIEIEKAAGRLSKLQIYVDDNASVSMSYIRSRCRLLKKKGNCEIVIIDYLQLAGESGQKNRNREQEVSQMSREAKIIAKELNIPVLLLSQLNRDSEKRQDKKPLLADLRESGAIEQDADMVIFIHRPEYYGIEVKDAQGNVIKNYGEFIIAKYRNGSTGKVKFRHNGSLTKIFDYDSKGHTQPQHSPDPENNLTTNNDELPF